MGVSLYGSLCSVYKLRVSACVCVRESCVYLRVCVCRESSIQGHCLEVRPPPSLGLIHIFSNN